MFQKRHRREMKSARGNSVYGGSYKSSCSAIDTSRTSKKSVCVFVFSALFFLILVATKEPQKIVFNNKNFGFEVEGKNSAHT